MATFNGGAGADVYNGTSGDDVAYGAGGNDTLNGNDGSDQLEGDAGNDTLNGGGGNDFLASYQPDAQFSQYPYQSTVSLDIYANADILSGGDGDDYMAAGFHDSVDGGTGRNALYINFLGAASGVHADFTLLYTQASITIGGATITNIASTPEIEGSNYDDYIAAISDPYAFTTVHGNGGNDHIIGDYYARAVYGDAGDDILDVRNSGYSPAVHGGDGNDTLLGGYNAPTLYGDAGDDTIDNAGGAYGGAGDDIIHLHFSYYGNAAYGDDGNDSIDGGADGASNQFYGGTGADHLDGNSGDDALYSDGQTAANGPNDFGLEQDTLLGGAGDDVLNIGYGDNADGGAGTDTLTLAYDSAAAGLKLKTAAIIGGAPFLFGAGVIQNIERLDSLFATGHDDVIQVAQQPGTVTVYGMDGNDYLVGLGSAVHLLGGAGDDILIAGAGGDLLEGGVGNDVFVIGGAGETVVEAVGEGVDKVKSSITYTLGDNVENLALTGAGNINGTGNVLANTIVGNSHNNQIAGMDGNDTLFGQGGVDTLNGGAGNDVLSGGDGGDTLSGGVGDDKIIGGAGADTMSGGGGADSFRFSAVADFGGATQATADRITDFNSASHDVIDLARIDAIAGGADDRFTLIGTAAFSSHAGELRYEQIGGDTYVSGDLNGDGAADFMIALTGLHTLTTADFVL